MQKDLQIETAQAVFLLLQPLQSGFAKGTALSVVLLWKSRGKPTFSKVDKLQGRGVLASKTPCLVQTPCAKTPEFGEAEFLDSMPVSALGTGVLISEFSAS